MNRLKTRSKVLDKLFNDLSLKYKILIVIFSGFFILFLSGLATMAFTSRSYEKRLYQSIAASMTYAASDISSQLQSVDSIIDSILASQVIQTNLEEMKELEQGSQRQIYNTRIYNELSGYLFAFQNDSISYMSIIQDQEIISTSLSSFMEVPYQLRSSLIARAQSREGARHAAGQLSGALSRRVGEIYSALVDLMAHFHAVLDYPDEDIDPFTQEQLSRDLTRQETALERLLATYRRGRQLSRGVRCTIVGRPNAGKSSLLNALVGYERAIVTDIPGTTRDTVEENVELGGVPLRLIDTAGLRDSADPIEQLGVERSRAAMEEAELILLVVDAAAEVTAEDAELARAVAESGKPWIFVAAKQDLVEQSTSVGLIGTEGRAAARTVELSSKTGEGLDSLAQAVAELFPRDAGSGYGELLTNARQAQAAQRALEGVKRAREALELGVTPDALLTDVEEALSALGELTGQSVSEDVTARIFQRFCVGK